MEKKFEELQLKDDFMFSVIMRNPRYCRPFLERVLDIKISRIEYPKSQETIDLSADAKSIRLDIYAESDEAVYNVEMQVKPNKNLPQRARYYGGMMDLSVLEKGEDYKNLKQSYVIFVCTFDPFGKGRHIYTFENRCIQEPELRLEDGTTKIILNTKGTMDDVTPEMMKLLDYIDGRDPGDDFTRELDEAVCSVRRNEKWRLDYMTLQMHYQEKYEQGIEQGIERGIQQGRMETTRRMIKAGKLSVDEIALYSGLTVEQVHELEKELQSV